MQKKGALISLVLMLGGCPVQSLAQPAHERHLLQILLAAHPDAPTHFDVVEQWDFSASPPTPGLGIENPITAWYLLPRRAKGDFKLRLEANPESARARLERYVVVEYPQDADLDHAISELQADANIEAVFMPFEVNFSSAIALPDSLKSAYRSGNQLGSDYGWVATNIAGAWQWAGGHSLIGVIDSGLATEHPQLVYPVVNPVTFSESESA